jgi:hypothetical protein
LSGSSNFQLSSYEICHSSLIVLQKQKTQKLTKTLENNKAKGLTSANQGVQIHNIWHSSLEMIRIKLIRRYQVKRDGISKLTGKLCPKVAKKLESIGLDAMECVPHFVGEKLFEVEAPKRLQYVVDLHNKTCGCRQWEMTGIPCVHAVSAILFDCGEPEDYVHEYYSIEMYKKAYAPLIYLMPSEEQWVRGVGHDILEPPRRKVAPGRPRKL